MALHQKYFCHKEKRALLTHIRMVKRSRDGLGISVTEVHNEEYDRVAVTEKWEVVGEVAL